MHKNEGTSYLSIITGGLCIPKTSILAFINSQETQAMRASAEKEVTGQNERHLCGATMQDSAKKSDGFNNMSPFVQHYATCPAKTDPITYCLENNEKLQEEAMLLY